MTKTPISKGPSRGGGGTKGGSRPGGGDGKGPKPIGHGLSCPSGQASCLWREGPLFEQAVEEELLGGEVGGKKKRGKGQTQHSKAFFKVRPKNLHAKWERWFQD